MDFEGKPDRDGEIEGYLIDERWTRKVGQVVDTTMSARALA
jgi:hypothetical protein